MALLYVLFFFTVLKIQTTFGNYCTYSETRYTRTYRHCGTWGWSRCTTYRPYTHYSQACCRGWTGFQCSTPICNNPCVNGGSCVGPDNLQMSIFLQRTTMYNKVVFSCCPMLSWNM